MYGLSQLYQIRGRVGRGDRQGFCYLVIPKEESLTDSAIERLKTIQEIQNQFQMKKEIFIQQDHTHHLEI